MATGFFEVSPSSAPPLIGSPSLIPSPPHPLSLVPQAPKWAAGVQFILVDVEPSQHDSGLAAATLVGDAAASLRVLLTELRGGRVQSER